MEQDSRKLGAPRSLLEEPTVVIQGEEFQLLREKLIFWAARKVLFGSDFHLAKTDIFQRAGVAVPNDVFHYDLLRLKKAAEKTGAERLLILGDFVHGKIPATNEQFRTFVEEMDRMSLRVDVILGNHDRSSEGVLAEEPRITVHFDFLRIDRFVFSHEPEGARETDENFYFYGHLHPLVVLKSRFDRLRLPCFVFQKNRAFLPAFSRFTAGQEFVFERGEDKAVYAVLPQKVARV